MNPTNKNKYVITALWLALEQAVKDQNLEAVCSIAQELGAKLPIKPIQPTILSQVIPKPTTIKPPSNARYWNRYVAERVNDFIDEFKASRYIENDGSFTTKDLIFWITEKQYQNKFFDGIEDWESRVAYSLRKYFVPDNENNYPVIKHINYGHYQFTDNVIKIKYKTGTA